MASFTGVGDTTSLTLRNKGEVAAIALSGTYSMVIALQRELGAPGSGAWRDVPGYKWSTADATVAANYSAQQDNERLRLIVQVDTSGTCTATLTDASTDKVAGLGGPRGDVMRVMDDGSVVFYDQDGNAVRAIGSPIVVTDAAAYACLAKNSGRLHIIPDLTADITITLPSPRAGLEFEFVYGGNAADAQDWLISTGSNTNYFKGGILHLDTDAGAGTDELVPVFPNGSSNSKFDFDTPNAGTRIRMLCDGTYWYLNGIACGVGAPTFADQ